MSRPGKLRSIQLRNLASTAIMSSKCPWMGQSFTIQTSPLRSMMLALTSPVFSVSNDCQFSSPFIILTRASFTHSGQRESVWRGHPNWGLVFCQDFKSGLSDHLGMKVGPGRYLLQNCTVSNTTVAVEQMAWSTYFMSR